MTSDCDPQLLELIVGIIEAVDIEGVTLDFVFCVFLFAWMFRLQGFPWGDSPTSRKNN